MISLTTKTDAKQFVSFAHPFRLKDGEEIMLDGKLCKVVVIVGAERSNLPAFCTLLTLGLTPASCEGNWTSTDKFYFYVAKIL